MLAHVFMATVLVAMVATRVVREEPVANQTDPRPPCSNYPYCQGTKFDESMMIDGKVITCDPYPHVRDSCCMPHDRHMVCYSIRCYGQFFDLDATEFVELCHAMLAVAQKHPGLHATVIKADGSGTIAYRYGEISSTAEGASDSHIHHLACSYQ